MAADLLEKFMKKRAETLHPKRQSSAIYRRALKIKRRFDGMTARATRIEAMFDPVSGVSGHTFAVPLDLFRKALSNNCELCAVASEVANMLAECVDENDWLNEELEEREEDLERVLDILHAHRHEESVAQILTAIEDAIAFETSTDIARSDSRRYRRAA